MTRQELNTQIREAAKNLDWDCIADALPDFPVQIQRTPFWNSIDFHELIGTVNQWTDDHVRALGVAWAEINIQLNEELGPDERWMEFSDSMVAQESLDAIGALLDQLRPICDEFQNEENCKALAELDRKKLENYQRG